MAPQHSHKKLGATASSITLTLGRGRQADPWSPLVSQTHQIGETYSHWETLSLKLMQRSGWGQSLASTYMYTQHTHTHPCTQCTHTHTHTPYIKGWRYSPMAKHFPSLHSHCHKNNNNKRNPINLSRNFQIQLYFSIPNWVKPKFPNFILKVVQKHMTRTYCEHKPPETRTSCKLAPIPNSRETQSLSIGSSQTVRDSEELGRALSHIHTHTHPWRHRAFYGWLLMYISSASDGICCTHKLVEVKESNMLTWNYDMVSMLTDRKGHYKQTSCT